MNAARERRPLAQREIDPYGPIIDDALAKFRRQPKTIAPDPVHRIPGYVLKLCESLLVECQKRREQGRSPLTLEQVLRADRLACGHTDYVSKLSLYCRELELG